MELHSIKMFKLDPVKGLANPDEGDWLRKEKEEEVVEKEEGVSKLVPATQGGICAGPGETAWEKSAPSAKMHTYTRP